MRRILSTVCMLAVGLAPAEEPKGGAFDGEWRTTIGIVKLKQGGDAVTGTYGNNGQFTLKGTVTGKMLKFEYQEGQAKGDAGWRLDETGHAFSGSFQVRGGRQGNWNGWRPDPEGDKGGPGTFAGLWLTNLGLMDLEQAGAKVKGRYALRGTSDLEGDVTGRRLEFRSKAFRSGKGWFDLAQAGKALAGAATTDGFSNWYGWRGRQSPEYVRHAKLVPGKLVDGSTNNLLTYTVRAPEGYQDGDKKTWPAVLILHGSNMNGKSYVSTLAASWPDIAKDYILIGVNGETPSQTGDDPQFNYTYVNFVGKSKFQGFPGTDRESPALVSEAMADLKTVYPIKSYFVGGHSQGGFLTYSLLMNYPDLVAGVFPVSCGLIFQCEPDAYADERLRQAQRAVPLAIVHGKNDPMVDFGMGRYAAGLFGESAWPALRFFSDDNAAHMFARLPVGEAIRWLEAMSSDDPGRLHDFAEAKVQVESYRDAVAAIRQARTLSLTAAQKEGLDKLAGQIDAKAGSKAKALLAKIQANSDGSWVDDFLAFRDEFEFADASRDAMKAFGELRGQHSELAQKALNDARVAFQQGRQNDGYAKYQEIVDKYYASSLYRNAKRWLAERK